MSTKLLALLSYLLLAFSTNVPLLAATDEIPEPVLDINGEKVVPGGAYYILPIFWGAGGGGLTLSDRFGMHTCPPYVVQSPFEVDNGLPVSFTPVNNEEVIRTSTDLNFAFLVKSPRFPCRESPVWRVQHPDQQIRPSYVTTGGTEGNPGQDTLSNWFKIEKLDGYGYKLVFCPSVCESCRPLCRDLGIDVRHDRIRRLVLSDTPHRVVFVKAFEENIRSVAS